MLVDGVVVGSASNVERCCGKEYEGPRELGIGHLAHGPFLQPLLGLPSVCRFLRFDLKI